jgi:hypothetical protein
MLPANRQPPTANRQPPTANRQPPTANRQPPTANRQPPIADPRPINSPITTASPIDPACESAGNRPFSGVGRHCEAAPAPSLPESIARQMGLPGAARIRCFVGSEALPFVG